MTNLNDINEILKHVLTERSKSKVVVHVEDSLKLIDIMLEKHNRSNYPREVKNALSYVHTTLTGVMHGVSTCVLKKSAVLDIIQICLIKLDIELTTDAPTEKESPKVRQEFSKDWKEALKLFKDQIENPVDTTSIVVDQDRVDADNFRKTIHEYAEQLPKSLKTVAKLIRLPVLPIGGSYNSVNKAKISRARLKTIEFDVYKIFIDQAILLVDIDKIEDTGKYMKRNSHVLNVTDILDTISAKLHTDYSLVTSSSVVCPKNSRISCFWVMETERLEIVSDVLSSTWGFPF